MTSSGFVLPLRLSWTAGKVQSIQPRRALCAAVSHENRPSIRVNHCFSKIASRRQADRYVDEGRVSVNGKIVQHGTRVSFGDRLCLDGQPIWDWERRAFRKDKFKYIKLWKGAGITCTTDHEIAGNIIDSLSLPFEERIFPVGRLDKSSTGLILLTSDGNVPKQVLGANSSCSKVYDVFVDKFVSHVDLDALRNGVTISTVAQRDRTRKTYTAKTLPCTVERLRGNGIRITLSEGRNRQIRKSLGALGYTALTLHRVQFGGVTLSGLQKPGDWAFLTQQEMTALHHNGKIDAVDSR